MNCRLSEDLHMRYVISSGVDCPHIAILFTIPTLVNGANVRRLEAGNLTEQRHLASRLFADEA